jgi:hypothetical protein
MNDNVIWKKFPLNCLPKYVTFDASTMLSSEFDVKFGPGHTIVGNFDIVQYISDMFLQRIDLFCPFSTENTLSGQVLYGVLRLTKLDFD